MLDADTRVATDPGARSGTAARTTFEGSPGMARRWRRTVPPEEMGAPGSCEVWAAVRADPDIDAEVQLRWGAPGPPDHAERAVRIPPGATGGQYRSLRLGTVSPRGGPVVLEGWAARRGTEGAMLWDRLWLAPVGSPERAAIVAHGALKDLAHRGAMVGSVIARLTHAAVQNSGE